MVVMRHMEAVSQLMFQEGWEVLTNFLTSSRESDMQALSSSNRKYPDDFYRGRIDVYNWFLDALPAEVAEYQREQKSQQTMENEGQPFRTLGHPYGPDEGGQPYLEGEDSK